MCLYILWAELREQVKSPYLLETISSATYYVMERSRKERN